MNPELNQKIFGYCERGGDPTFWAEPLNAVTNAAFIVAALAIVVLLLRRDGPERTLDVWLMAIIVAVIGVGSFLFHTYATRWAAIADVAPIGLFILVYFAFVLGRFLCMPPGIAIMTILGFFGAIAYVATQGQPGVRFAGLMSYLPALVLLFVMGTVCLIRGHPAWAGMWSAAAVFAVSLTLRTIDREVCDQTVIAGVTIGTHFLWHILNGVTLFILMLTALRHWRYEQERRALAGL